MEIQSAWFAKQTFIIKNMNMFYCKNCLDFLAKVGENVCSNLNRLLTLNNNFACKIVNQEYYYDHKDWFTGEKLFSNLELCLSKWKKNK